jgi:hypothetical protein
MFAQRPAGMASGRPTGSARSGAYLHRSTSAPLRKNPRHDVRKRNAYPLPVLSRESVVVLHPGPDDLRLATELERDRSNAPFVLDEQSVGLDRLDISVLLTVLDRLGARGGTVVVINHDLGMIAEADYAIDMVPAAASTAGTW